MSEQNTSNKSIEEIADLNYNKSSITSKVTVKQKPPKDKLFIFEVVAILSLTVITIFYLSIGGIFIFWLSYVYILTSALIRKKSHEKNWALGRFITLGIPQIAFSSLCLSYMINQGVQPMGVEVFWLIYIFPNYFLGASFVLFLAMQSTKK